MNGGMGGGYGGGMGGGYGGGMGGGYGGYGGYGGDMGGGYGGDMGGYGGSQNTPPSMTGGMPMRMSLPQQNQPPQNQAMPAQPPNMFGGPLRNGEAPVRGNNMPRGRMDSISMPNTYAPPQQNQPPQNQAMPAQPPNMFGGPLRNGEAPVLGNNMPRPQQNQPPQNQAMPAPAGQAGAPRYNQDASMFSRRLPQGLQALLGGMR